MKPSKYCCLGSLIFYILQCPFRLFTIAQSAVALSTLRSKMTMVLSIVGVHTEMSVGLLLRQSCSTLHLETLSTCTTDANTGVIARGIGIVAIMHTGSGNVSKKLKRLPISREVDHRSPSSVHLIYVLNHL